MSPDMERAHTAPLHMTAAPSSLDEPLATLDRSFDELFSMTNTVQDSVHGCAGDAQCGVGTMLDCVLSGDHDSLKEELTSGQCLGRGREGLGERADQRKTRASKTQQKMSWMSTRKHLTTRSKVLACARNQVWGSD